MTRICAVDEVGCASIAGPVVVCAVVAEPGQKIPGVKDSKKLSKKKREELAPLIEQSLDFALGAVSPRGVEKINLYWARFLAMRRAVERLLSRGVKFDKIIVDGNKTIDGLPPSIPQEAHTKADDKFWEASAASIVAKVRRDNLMTILDSENKYGWATNAGYFSPEHRMGIVKYGPTPYHRRTFDYFRFCLQSHKEFLRFKEEGKTLEDWIAFDDARKQEHGCTAFSCWKRGEFTKSIWEPVTHGNEG